MSQEKFTELLKDEQTIGAVEAMWEGVQAIAPGLSLSKILSDVGHELSHQVEMGSHELASVLYRGDAFVMYPKVGKEEESHGLSEQAREQIQEHERER